jgi:hypothetical protein
MFYKVIRYNIIFLFLARIYRRYLLSAYIDPNTGGMLFQLLAVLFGLFSGLILFFSSQIKKAIYRGMRTLRGKNSEEEGDTEA